MPRLQDRHITQKTRANQAGRTFHTLSADLFAHESFGGAGTCETCHLNGGRDAGKLPNGKAIPSLIGAAAAFPRYSPRVQSVITLSQQIARCIGGALKGTPPAFGSPDLVALDTYITSLSKGVVMGRQFE